MGRMPLPRGQPPYQALSEHLAQSYPWLNDLPMCRCQFEGMGTPKIYRSTKQLIDALEEFRHLGVDFISITEQIDTGSPMGKAMFTVISAIAEFERSLISERVRSGLAKARAHGKQLGRPKTSPETIKEIQRLRKQGMSLTQTAKQLGVSYQTVANYS